MENITINPDLQATIVNLLPDDQDEAMEIMCQLIANFILSMENKSEQSVSELIHKHLISYKGN